ncbi:hypothetical protein [Agromyces albus]|uniref:Uncharacterized protein n=1 Tax=Agromyces albus TaxID=205332 RepID=A0A4Q2L387_9MICO|nr:hypothetical protein [Agromyces albus]RXZ72009.1 hypothetical protein ESP51_06465 [Agromyces albus]
MPRSRPARSARHPGVFSLAAAGAIALVLSGCVGAPEPTPTPSTPTDAAEPIFASDEEALAAAEEAYERFLVATAEVTGSGGTDLGPLAGVAIGDANDAQIETAASYVEDGLRSIGRRTFVTYELQSHDEDPSRGAVVAFYVCDDLRGLDVVDINGASVVSPDRVLDVPYLVVAEGRAANDLEISAKDLWERENFCG